MSSSGLEPGPSSKRELNEDGPWKAPEASTIVPEPSFRFPCQRADEVRVGMNQTLVRGVVGVAAGVRNAYDAVVIGAGHNGLVAAAYLARAGRRILVCERRHVVGG